MQPTNITLSVAVIVSTTVIALAVVACTTALGMVGTLDASAVTGILGGVMGLAGGAGAAKIGSELSTNGAQAAAAVLGRAQKSA
jgi:hypothetical protein